MAVYLLDSSRSEEDQRDAERALRTSLSTHRDLLLENLALRHQTERARSFGSTLPPRNETPELRFCTQANTQPRSD